MGYGTAFWVIQGVRVSGQPHPEQGVSVRPFSGLQALFPGWALGPTAHLPP